MTTNIGSFKVMEIEGFDKDNPARNEDRYHQYTTIGFNASNTVHHHKYGDVTILFRDTSPEEEFNAKDPAKRYIIIADQWSGMRLKVILPEVKF